MLLEVKAEKVYFLGYLDVNKKVKVLLLGTE
ncbi:MAG: hypothetical protein KatS3mg003_0565 [Candidatus Nitrosocaldaceae archaeon]|nr:MAG: hypothetical protein KatS3mg003_0565 [Candidatus Nitrosocaldaceae archaeon]